MPTHTLTSLSVSLFTENHQCCYCSKYFFNEELLTSHMYIHVNRYKCSLCDMTCPSPSGLASHVRYRHIPEKPFKCQLCVFACTHKRDLEKHMLSKHEKHVYECDEFDCGFLTESLFMMNKVRISNVLSSLSLCKTISETGVTVTKLLELRTQKRYY